MSPRFLGAAGMVGIGYFVAAVLALHFLEPGFSPADEYISDYANAESFGWVMRTAFFGAAIGTASIGVGLRATLAPGNGVAASWGLLLGTAVLWVFVGLFNGDPTGTAERTATGGIHDLASAAVFLSLLINAWLLRGVFERTPGWEPAARPQLWFAVGYSVTLLVSFFSPLPVGATQRVFVVVMMAWLAFLAWQVRTHASVQMV